MTEQKSKIRKWAIIVVRFLLGAGLLFNGINMFAMFMPLPNPQQGELATRFLTILGEAGYFYPILGTVKILTALALFTNRYMALMLVIMFPITLNGILFHFRMDPSTQFAALFVGLLQVYLMYESRDRYFDILRP
ncbi:hypothetical protein [Maribacter sp. 2-571]|uniref:hypothetical protein n=1 Tax=Maribacter sp. 2-571 TaxID=3417569 RepID=UPI003D346C39